MTEPTFSIIIPTYRRPEVLRRVVDAYLATNYPQDRFEIIVVDDGHAPETRRVVEEAEAGSVNLMLVKGRGEGAAAARNDGARAASGDFLVHVDDDILVPPNHLTAQLEVREVHGECISGAEWWRYTPESESDLRATPLGRYLLALEASQRKRPAERWTFERGLATGYLVVRRDVFEELDGFDERFPRAGVEDWEFCLRAGERGHKLIRDNELDLLQDETRVTISQFCTREEWRGFSVGVLARLHPDLYHRDIEVVRENTPVRPDDPLRLRLKKGVKRVLGIPIVLAALHRSLPLFELLLRPERLLHRLYTAVISVHYLRGFRGGFSSTSASDVGA
jgi:glycosyltransferase involved in cell wall biosynthesis